MILAVDIGGTKTLLAVFDENGQITEKNRFPTPQDYEEFKQHLAEEVAKFTTSTFNAAAVAVPGRIDRQKGIGIAFGNLPWENVPIQSDCQQILGCPVQIENDANLAGLSEAQLLKDQYRKVLYVTISTGIGGVLVVDGAMDPDTLDAEIGHTLYPHEGKLEEWEDFASGKAILERYGKRAEDISDPAIWQQIAEDIALGLFNVIATLTPEVIVIGGGVGTHLEKFQSLLGEALKKHADPMINLPVIVEAQRPEEAVIYGCFELAKASQS